MPIPPKGKIMALKVLFHLILTIITGGLWLVVLVIHHLVKKR